MGLVLSLRQFFALFWYLSVKRTFRAKKAAAVQVFYPIAILGMMMSWFAPMSNPSAPEYKRAQFKEWSLDKHPGDGDPLPKLFLTSEDPALEATLVELMFPEVKPEVRKKQTQWFESSEAMQKGFFGPKGPQRLCTAALEITKKGEEVGYNLWLSDIDTSKVRSATPSFVDSPAVSFLDDGSATLQTRLHSALMEHYTSNSLTFKGGQHYQRFPANGPKENSEIAKIYARVFSIPFLGVLTALAAATSFVGTVSGVVHEKEYRLRQSMMMAGLTRGAYIAERMLAAVLAFIIVLIGMMGMYVPVGVFHGNSMLPYAFTILLIIVANVAFGFAFSALRQNARGAGLMGFLFYAGLIGLGAYLATDPKVSASAKFWSCSLPPCAFCVVAGSVLLWSNAGGGFNGETLWKTLPESANADYPTNGSILILIACSIPFWILVNWYLEAIIPGVLGMARPFYFPLSPSYWKEALHKTPSEVAPIVGNQQNVDRENVERALVGDPSVVIDGLTRKFGDFTAVDGLSLDMYEGEVLSLLGHNGAGKTTTLSMLTGLIAPTSGDATLYGKSVSTEMPEARRLMGFCPQHDIIFDRMTVAEHVRLFTLLKGVSVTDASEATKDSIQAADLVEKEHSLAHNLSGGQKRKMAVAMAFAGNSRVVFLDEPTSGMDPVSRRAIWDIIIRNKAGRVVVLTTHFMDEADLLGDKIAIMQHGGLRAVGSSTFLKKKFGIGYSLVMAKEDRADNDEIIRFIEGFSPCAVGSDAGKELGLRLPNEAGPKLADMFTQLDQNMERLGVATYGLSLSTLEEVFLRLAQDGPEEMGAARVVPEGYTEGDMDGGSAGDGFDQPGPSVDPRHSVMVNMDDAGLGLADGINTRAKKPNLLRQAQALLFKRYCVTKRDREALIYQIVYPVFFLFAGLIVMKTTTETFASTIRTLPLTDDLMGAKPKAVPSVLAFTNTNASRDTFRTTFGKDGIDWDFSTVSGEHTMSTVYALVGEKPNSGAALYAKSLVHVAPKLTRDLVDKAASMAANGTGGPGFEFEDMTQFYNPSLTFAPAALQFRMAADMFQSRSAGVRLKSGSLTNLPTSPAITGANGQLVFLVALAFAFAFVPASYASFIVKEREVNATFLQLMSGCPLWLYWGTAFLWDAVLSLVYSGVAIGVMAIFLSDSFNTYKTWGVVFYGMNLYCWTATLLTYNLSFLFERYSKAQLTLAAAMAGTSVMFVISDISVGLSTGPASVAHFVTEYSFCGIIPTFAIAKIIGNSINFIGEYSARAAIAPDGADVWSYEMFGVFFHILYYQFAGYLFLLIIRQVKWRGIGRRCCSRFRPYSEPDRDQTDPDVYEEYLRISERKENDILQAVGLHKNYGGKEKKVAVNNTYLGIKKGECFGLLGANGAGKTSTIKMMTGETHATRGTVIVDGIDLNGREAEIRAKCGLCPQFDSVLHEMTGEEALWFFAHLKGLPPASIDASVDAFIDAVGIQKYRKRPCGKYSGGNRRKLSLAIALLGHPPVVFLDEPSTGMDPQARRQMWKLVSAVCANHAIVLTSHSMEEVEALCTRLSIMTKGDLRCLGNPQHLKSKFGQGYSVEVTLYAQPPGSPGNWSAALIDFMARNFPSCSLREQHQQRFRYELSNDMRLSSIFTLLEGHKESMHMQEYAVSQTTLEQVFNNIVKEEEHPVESGTVASDDASSNGIAYA